MSDKKGKLRPGQSLAFSSDTPNFLKMLQAQHGLGETAKKDIEREDREDLDDEKPQIELGTGVSEAEAQLALEKLGTEVGGKKTVKASEVEKKVEVADSSLKATTDKKRSAPETTIGSQKDKKRKGDWKKEVERQSLKAVKNKKLLSFDDEDE
jgi:hypothetical protein